jgi:hypothetical protein
MKGMPSTDRIREIKRMIKWHRMKLYHEIYNYILNKTGCAIFGGAVRDRIRLDSGFVDEGAFKDIDVVIDPNWVQDQEGFDLVIKEIRDHFICQSCITYAPILGMPGESRYAGKTLKIIGFIPYIGSVPSESLQGFKDATFHIDIDFVFRTVDTKLDLSIGSLIQPDEHTYKLRTSDKYGLTFGKVLNQILRKEFEIVGIKKDADFDCLPTETARAHLFRLIQTIKILMRATDKMNNGWTTDWSDFSVCKTLHKAEGKCSDCGKYPKYKPSRKDIGKWSLGTKCCKMAISLSNLYQLVTDALTEMKTYPYLVKLKCPFCTKGLKL